VIGVLGAGGETGRATVRLLEAAGLGEVRAGGRREHADLDRFCAGCRVVVNCTAAPDRERVAAAAMLAGAHYVDPAGDGSMVREIARICRRRTAVLAAGASPGLTGLLPRWLASSGFERTLVLTGYACAMDRFSPGSAADFLRSLGRDEGGSRAVWRGGARIAQASGPLARVDLPFFADPMAAFPYLSAEIEEVARRLGLREVRWYSAFHADGRMYGALPRLREALARGGEPRAVAAELARVAEQDLFGRRPLHQVVIQLDGEAAGRPVSRVAVLHATGTYELTGAVVALAVQALLAGALPPGAALAADALDPSCVERLRHSPAVTALHLLEGPIEAYAEVEQGAL
jgi:hypothetical protein